MSDRENSDRWAGLWGWSRDSAGLGDHQLGRIVFRGGDRWFAITAQGETEVIRGSGLASDPVVGDWVALDYQPERVAIQEVLPRTTELSRRGTGPRLGRQILAANLDLVGLTIGLEGGRSLSRRRIERMLVLVHESGARPLLILSKADLMPERTEALELIHEAWAEADYLFCSSVTGEGLPELKQIIAQAPTLALIGLSGSGKSSLVNALLGYQRQAIGEVRADDLRGRHTTSARELIRLESGGMIVDTPGMREFSGGDRASINRVFPELAGLEPECHFNNCTHHHEPDCAVLKALAEGRLDQDRYEHWLDLIGELDYQDPLRRQVRRRIDNEASKVERREYNARYKRPNK